MKRINSNSTLFEKYCYIKAYARFMETELSRVRIEKGMLQSEVARFEYLAEDVQKELIKEEKYRALQSQLDEQKSVSKNLLFKLNKETTKNICSK